MRRYFKWKKLLKAMEIREYDELVKLKIEQFDFSNDFFC